MEHASRSASARPPSEAGPARVRAATLKEAFRRARAIYGEDARILQSRTVVRRQPGGLGQERLVELTVAADAAEAAGVAASLEAGSGPRAIPERLPEPPAPAVAMIAAEVARLEELVADLQERAAGPLPAATAAYPLAADLLAAGAGAGVVERLAARFAAEAAPPRPGAGAAAAREAALAHLAGQLPCAGGDWESLAGCHVFLGEAGAGKSDLVFSAAARLRRAGRQVLVLSLLPRHGGEVRRLQEEAAAHAYDAALIQRGAQLVRLEEHVRRYEVVLVDTPALGEAGLARAQDLRELLAGDGACHRHLVVALDGDPAEGARLRAAARQWNCDWLALSRLDCTARPGKLLDLRERLGLPLSLCRRGPWPSAEPEPATAAMLVELLTSAAPGRRAAAAL